MFHFPLIGRRTTLRRAPRSSQHLLLERLEDRVVPNGAPPIGTILFTNYHSGNDLNTNAPNGILGIRDPTNYAVVGDPHHPPQIIENGVRVLLGNGDGTFQTAKHTPLTPAVHIRASSR